MPLRLTKEVIDGDYVTRFNGNNLKGSRSRGDPGRGAERLEKERTWHKAKARKRTKEKEYARRYLGGR